jgi:predicted nucleic acid-binding protein
MSTCYFVDTSIWIDYFRNPACATRDFIKALVEEDRVYINGIVIAEMLTGAKTPKELDLMYSAFRGLRFLEMGSSIFYKSGQHGFTLKRLGITVPLSDLIIATHCLEHEIVLIASDRHFDVIAEHLPLKQHDKRR